MSNNQKTKQAVTEAPELPPMKAETFFDLNLSLHEIGNDSSDASIIFSALELYRNNTLKFILHTHAEQQYEDAHYHMKHYRNAADIQNKLFDGITRIALLNALKFDAKGLDPAFRKEWVTDIEDRSEEDPEFTLQDYLQMFLSLGKPSKSE